jgi:FkbM family methyltransferase
MKEQIYVKNSLWHQIGSIINYFLSSYPFKGSGRLKILISKIFIPKPTGPILIRTVYGFDIICTDPINDKGVEKPLYLTGSYEAGTLSIIRKCLRKGDIFIDIGANIGLMSIFASRIVGNEGIVYSFEPVPETFMILKKNIEINNVKNISALDIALSNTNRTYIIYTNPYGGKGSSSFIKPLGQSGVKEYKVIAKRFDEFLATNYIANIRMIKIDVEGWELYVLKGAKFLLHNYDAPIICVEYSKLTGDNKNPIDLYNFIAEVNNYQIYKLKKGKGIPSKLTKIKDTSDLPIHDNLFCFLPIHLKDLPKSLFDE